MLYRGALDIIEKATSLGLPTSIATNGTRVADAAQRLVQAPLFLLQISIDGHCAELHNRLRPSAGATDNFSEIEDALRSVHEERKAQNRRLPLIASLTVISKANFRHIVDIYETFRQRVDLFVFYLAWWIDSDRARSHEEDFHKRFGFFPTRHRGWMGDWKPDDYTELNHQLQSLLTLSTPWKMPPVTVIPLVSGKENLKRYYTQHAYRFGFDRCISIYQAVEVNSNGNISPCRDYHDYVVGNIKTTSVTDLWNSPRYIKFRKSLTNDGIMPVCSRCCGLMGY
jgi:radical SAM protein with 4Fe4S-binding SPASM domain